ncbi:hypothetical protein IC582_017358 [Cucumis melo]
MEKLVGECIQLHALGEQTWELNSHAQAILSLLKWLIVALLLVAKPPLISLKKLSPSLPTLMLEKSSLTLLRFEECLHMTYLYLLMSKEGNYRTHLPSI